jgi:hypothetical protein
MYGRKAIKKRLYLCLAPEKHPHRRRMYVDAFLTRTKTTWLNTMEKGISPKDGTTAQGGIFPD